MLYIYMCHILVRLVLYFMIKKRSNLQLHSLRIVIEHEIQSYFYVLVAFSLTSCYNLPRFGILLLCHM